MPDSTPPICNYEGSDYQASFWEQGGRAYEDAVELVALKRLLPPTGGELLLELGAGAGRNTNRYTNYEHIVLVDYSRTQLVQAQQRLGRSARYVYVAADIYNLPFVSGLFDSATMIRALHHMADPRRALRETHQVMKPGAPFILEFANKHNLKAILRYLLRRQTWSPFSPEPVEFVPLNFDFHPATVRAWLRMEDFRIQRQLTVSHYRSGFFKRWFPMGLLVAMDSLAQLTGDWWQLSPSVFVLSTAAGGETGVPPSPQKSFFKCLACGAPIPEAPLGETLTCPNCRKVWVCEDGIYDFRVATQPE